jgi:hypothetical protein
MKGVTHIEQLIKKVMANALGARQTIEYYIRCFYRQIFIDPIDRSVCFKDRLFWLTRILKPYGLTERAKLLVIIFGPLISLTPSPGSLPYIGWWDLTDTFFIQSGLEELGFAIHLLYTHHKEDDIWNKQSLLSINRIYFYFQFKIFQIMQYLSHFRCDFVVPDNHQIARELAQRKYRNFTILFRR